MDAQPELRNHTLGDRYRIDHELGRGGMATVYLATDLKHQRDVAIKVLHPGVAAALMKDRFLREIEIVSRLSHPHVVALFDSGTDDGLIYFVMPCVKGESLRGLLEREGTLALAHALRLTREIASGLSHAHQHGIVHRDIKPENVLLVDGIAVVADFGVGRAFHAAADAGGEALTEAGLVLGTPHYMSPEQATGEFVDARSDIYSLACLLFELLIGRPPFSGAQAQSLIAAHVTQTPPLASDLAPSVPAAISDVIAKALSKLPDERYASAAQFAEALAGAARAVPTWAPPTMQAASSALHNLPVERTRFVGREGEIADVCALLRGNRVVTLSGIGGCGKTRLALAVARTLLPDFRDGAWFVDLSPLRVGEHVIQPIAAALEVSEAPGRDLTDLVSDHVAARQMLLVLDNCEHLNQACAKVADRLLQAAPSLTILATSRELLGVQGEVAFALRPLAVPSTDAACTVESLCGTESVRLFMDRAQLAAPSFALTEQNARTVAEICRRLDGIPLALELAAARVKVLSAEQIRDRLADRFRLLAGSSKTVLPRHQTLAAAIQWSYDQLTEPDQWLLRTLSVFAGGWTLSAATAMQGNGTDEFAVLDAMERLVDKCLVFLEYGVAEGATRYRMLETVRQFCRERLEESSEADRARRAHCDVFIALAERAYEQRTSNESEWTRRLDADHDNLRAALETAKEVGNEDYLRLAGALAWFWLARSHMLEGRAHLIAALSGAPESGDISKARALSGLGVMLGWHGDGAASIKHTEEAIAIWRRLGVMDEAALGLEGLGWALFLANQEARAESTFLECLSLQTDGGDPVLINRARVGVAQAQVALHKVVEARALAKQVITLSAESQELRNEHFGWHFLADCALIEGDCAESLRLYQKSLELAQAMGDRIEIGAEVQGVAMSLAGLGEGGLALRLVSATEAEWRRMDVNIQIRFWNELLDRYMAKARDGMAAAESSRAWEEGAQMDFEDAVAMALAVPARPMKRNT